MAKPLEGKKTPLNHSNVVDFTNLTLAIPVDSFTIELEQPPDEKELHKEMLCRFACCTDDKDLFETFLNYPPLQKMHNPITIISIQQHQFKNLDLNRLKQQFLYCYPVKEI